MKVVLALVCCLLPSFAFAQAHPCDAPPQSTGNATAGVVQVGWCHDKKDTNGNATSVTAWTLRTDSVTTALTGVTTNNVANASGQVFYQANVNFAQGNFTVTIAATNGVGEGAPSSPFALSVNAPSAVPSAPNRIRVG